MKNLQKFKNDLLRNADNLVFWYNALVNMDNSKHRIYFIEHYNKFNQLYDSVKYFDEKEKNDIEIYMTLFKDFINFDEIKSFYYNLMNNL